jgi:hypothetical protein
MAKVEVKKIKKGKGDISLPFERENYIIVGVGILVIILGYFALSQDGAFGFMPLTVAPILLVLGYCVIIPIGIMYRKRTKPVQPTETPVAH